MGSKFKVGDVVYTKNGIGECTTSARVGILALPKVVTIISVFTEECHGGIQFHYLARLEGDLIKFNEVELLDQSEWDISAWMNTWSEAKKAHPEIAKAAGQPPM
jgi:hypothetical protein